MGKGVSGCACGGLAVSWVRRGRVGVIDLAGREACLWGVFTGCSAWWPWVCGRGVCLSGLVGLASWWVSWAWFVGLRCVPEGPSRWNMALLVEVLASWVGRVG